MLMSSFVFCGLLVRMNIFLYVCSSLHFLVSELSVFTFAHLSIESVIVKTLPCPLQHYSFPYLGIKTFLEDFL